ncbi:signal peptidase I [Cohnella cellulosilytica]|uniref:Signal peptidase I n=1 Tax=Cohnella cellulosilytica TaxID=986710 RepID=A0ABW2F292_9BACL
MWRIIIIFIVAFSIIGCQNEVIQDPNTESKLQYIEPTDSNVIVRILNDAMLGLEIYSDKDLVVDTEYYRNGNIQRGDVVYFSYPEDILLQYPALEQRQILRVIGLRGEKISMKQGQIFINGNKLDTFYGKDMNNDGKDLRKRLKNPELSDNEKENLQNLIQIVESENINEQFISEGKVFLVGDNRMQAVDSIIIGPIAEENIIGKVVGYKN